MINITKPRSVNAAIRTLSEEERHRVLGLFDHLANWENDPHLREISKPSIYKDCFALNTSDDIRIFFKLDLEKKEITILDISKPSRFKTASAVSE
jgi:hypothetical protein